MEIKVMNYQFTAKNSPVILDECIYAPWNRFVVEDFNL